MSCSLEDTLVRELREIAADLPVPPMPDLPARRTGAGRWAPALVAAAVVLVLLGAIGAIELAGGNHTAPMPGGPSPTHESTRTTDAPQPVPTVAPSVPYVLDGSLVVGGHQVPGDWVRVWSGGVAWLAWRSDGTWWYGTDARAHRIEGVGDATPVLSPGGAYAAWVDSRTAMVTGFETRVGGEGLGGAPVDLGDPALGDPVRVRAVTDDGLVVVQGQDVAVLWRPLVDNATIDLASTAPGEVVLGNSPAGLLVGDRTDSSSGRVSLAQLSEDGTITRTTPLPAYDDLEVSPDGGHVLWSPPGTLAGEVTAVDSLQVAPTGGAPSTIAPPEGWRFATLAWAWEDQTFVARVVDGGGRQRMVRCDPDQLACVLLRTP